MKLSSINKIINLNYNYNMISFIVNKMKKKKNRLEVNN